MTTTAEPYTLEGLENEAKVHHYVLEWLNDRTNGKTMHDRAKNLARYLAFTTPRAELLITANSLEHFVTFAELSTAEHDGVLDTASRCRAWHEQLLTEQLAERLTQLTEYPGRARALGIVALAGFAHDETRAELVQDLTKLTAELAELTAELAEITEPN